MINIPYEHILDGQSLFCLTMSIAAGFSVARSLIDYDAATEREWENFHDAWAKWWLFVTICFLFLTFYY